VCTYWLRQLRQRQVGPAARAERRPRPRVRPGVEQLEGRLTPSTTTTLSLSADQVVEGGKLTETAQVVDATGLPIPVGKVTFTYDGTAAGSYRLQDQQQIGIVSSNLTVPSGAGTPGWHTLRADYDGSDPTTGMPFLPNSSDSKPLNVLEATDVQGTVLGNNFAVGQTITLQGQVSAHYGADPVPQGGELAFLVDGQGVAKSPLDAQGAASFNLSGVDAGVHELTVQYSGADNPSPQVSFAATPVSAPVTFIVTRPFATVAVTSPTLLLGSRVAGPTRRKCLG
jgi:hypothetical protein